MKKNGKAAESKSYWTDTCETELKVWVASDDLDHFQKKSPLKLFLKKKLLPDWCISGFPLGGSGGLRWKVFQGFWSPSLMKKIKVTKCGRYANSGFIGRCMANYWPSMEIGLDGAIEKFKGRYSFKQDIQNKPVRWGMKILCGLLSWWWSLEFWLYFVSAASFHTPDKHAQFFSDIPLLTGSKSKKRQMLCRECKERRSKFWCAECTAPLCKGLCFRKYHTNS